MTVSDEALRTFVMAIVAADGATADARLEAAPELVRARFQQGASRHEAGAFFIDAVERYIVVGDSVLHFAAAAYQAGLVRMLICAGADVHAKNRFGDQPLHAAAAGDPNTSRWNPAAQVATIECLIEAGADPNAMNQRGVAPLHVAVRTRCADAVRVLLRRGADPELRKMSGSTPVVLAKLTTGRGGTGSIDARVQRQEIVRLLEEKPSVPSH